MATTTAVPAITLNNGVEIPQLGFGVFQIPPEQTKEATLVALEAGYRHIDTAQMYRNEQGVGEAVRASGLNRGDVFVTSKLSNAAHERQAALDAFDRTLDALDLGYVDLFLIHWPMLGDGFIETWKAMESMYETGTVRAIGVSNFHEHHLRHLFAETTVIPAVNQIEVHPYLTQDALRAFDAEHGIATEAWSPIAQGLVLTDPVVSRISNRVEKTPAQIVLRWHIQRGDIIFPKSVTKQRVDENFAIFDFELSDADMSDISALDKHQRTGADPETANFVPR